VNFGEGIIQTRALFEFRFVQRRLAHEVLGGFAAAGADGVNFESDTSCAAYRQRRFTFS
jgi:hypothetical protein